MRGGKSDLILEFNYIFIKFFYSNWQIHSVSKWHKEILGCAFWFPFLLFYSDHFIIQNYIVFDCHLPFKWRLMQIEHFFRKYRTIFMV